jgi:DNA-binding cell septation regulator SpoVG
MPREKGSDDKWYDSVRPLTKEARAEIQNKVLEEYNK